MKTKIIGIIGGILILISLVSPWLVIRGGKTFYGFNFYGINPVFNLLFIVMIILSLVGIILSLIKNKVTDIFLLVIGILFIGLGFFLKFVVVKSFGIPYIWEKYGAEWMGETVSAFFNIGYGIYILIIGGILILISGIVKIKGEFFYNLLLKIKNKIRGINTKIKVIILIGILVAIIIPIGKNWFLNQQTKRISDYQKEAREKQDVSICEKIKNEGERGYCYIGVAEIKKDSSICEKIEIEYLKNSCYEKVAIAKQDYNTCELIRNQSNRNFCYKGVAVAMKDSELCKKMDIGLYYLEGCYKDVAEAKQDLDLCGKITFQDIKSECYRKIAAIKQDSEICYQFRQDLNLFGCYEDVAVVKKDPNICEKIKAQPEKDWCYYWVAKEAKNSDICGKILDNSIQESCYKRTKY